MGNVRGTRLVTSLTKIHVPNNEINNHRVLVNKRVHYCEVVAIDLECQCMRTRDTDAMQLVYGWPLPPILT